MQAYATRDGKHIASGGLWHYLKFWNCRGYPWNKCNSIHITLFVENGEHETDCIYVKMNQYGPMQEVIVG